jgi:hypothetical protein
MHHRLEMSKCKRTLRIYGGDNGSDDDDVVYPAGSANEAEYYAGMVKNYDKTQLTRKIYASRPNNFRTGSRVCGIGELIDSRPPINHILYANTSLLDSARF